MGVVKIDDERHGEVRKAPPLAWFQCVVTAVRWRSVLQR